MHTNVNVVIPAYKPDQKLIEIFKMMEASSHPVEKIIVMNTVESDDDKEGRNIIKLSDKYGYAYNKDFIEIIDVNKEDFDHGRTRKEGATHISKDCDYILFMTQDAVPYDSELIKELLNGFSVSDDDRVENSVCKTIIGVSYARQLARETSSLAEKFTRNFNYPDEDMVKSLKDIETLGIKAFFCSNVCAMYKRDIYESLGGFIDRAVFNEDMVFANKLIKNGYAIKYASKAKVYHTHDYTGMQQYKRNFDLAVSQKMNPDAFEGISSESEGIKYVIAAFKYFCKNKRPFEIIPFGINCVYKYLGYRKGKRYNTLSKEQILKCTSNRAFFENGE